MTLTLEQFRERVIDYLYGELDGEELRAFEATLAESDACRRELEALQGTLGTARQGLRGPLSQEPPARVRNAVLAAASLEARVLADRQARTIADRERGGGRRVLDALQAFLRTPWLFPALGAAAAVLFVVLRERAEHLESGELAAPGQAAVERAAPLRGEPPPSVNEENASATQVEVEARAGARERKVAEQAAAQPAPSSEPHRPSSPAPPRARREAKGFATPPPEAPKKAERPAERFAEASHASEDSAREGEAPVREEPAGGLARAKYGAAPSGAPPADESPPAAVEARARAGERSDVEARARAGERSDVEARARVGERSDVEARAGAGERSDVEARARAGERSDMAAPAEATSADKLAARAPEPAPSASAAGSGRSFAKPPPPPTSVGATPLQEPAAARVSSAAGARDARAGRAELAKAAREHVLARRWQRAAEAYTELLRRFPDDREAPEWRKQLALARQALGTGARDAAR